MSANWNLANIRRIAGLPLNEGWSEDDDYSDDEDPDVKIASSDKKQAAFEKKNKKQLTTADKEATAKAAEAKAKKPAAKKEEPKAEEKKPAPKAEKKAEEPKKEAPKEEPKAEEKKEEAKAEAKRRGKAPNPESKTQRAIAWHNSHKSAPRREFIAYAKTIEMSPHQASALFARINPRSSRQAAPTTECWVITHPHMPSFMLAENREMNQMQWVDPSSPLNCMVFETEAEAQKVARYMAEWKSQASTIQKITFED